MSSTDSAIQPPSDQLRQGFDTAAAPSLAQVKAALESNPPFNERWRLYRTAAQIGGNDAADLLAAALPAEKDAGIRYMTASLLRDIAKAAPDASATAAQAVAKAATQETDAYARRSMELSLADIAATAPATTAIAAQALAANLSKPSDTLTRSLQAGQLSDFVAAAPQTGAQILPAVITAFAQEKDKLAAHHLARTLTTIAHADATQRPAVIAAVMTALTTPPSQAHPLEKTFAAASALHSIGSHAPADVTQALAQHLTQGAAGDNARRLCILGLGAFAEADKDCAKTAAKALLKALTTESDALHRRHIVDGVMKAVYNGFSSQSAGGAFYAHLNARERDRETREKISRSLRQLGHKTPTTPMSIPAPKA